jgi:hypothetical protein
MSLAIAVPRHIAELQARYRAKGVLSAADVQTLLDWQLQTVDASHRQAKEAGAVGTLQPGDLVEFQMPRTVQGGTYMLNRAYYGTCRAPYEVFCELARMREQDIIGLQELGNRRGEPLLGTGLRDHIEVTVPALHCRLVQRAAEVQKDAARAAAVA